MTRDDRSEACARVPHAHDLFMTLVPHLPEDAYRRGHPAADRDTPGPLVTHDGRVHSEQISGPEWWSSAADVAQGNRALRIETAHAGCGAGLFSPLLRGPSPIWSSGQRPTAMRALTSTHGHSARPWLASNLLLDGRQSRREFEDIVDGRIARRRRANRHHGNDGDHSTDHEGP